MTPASSANYPRTFKDFIERFDSEDACLEYVERETIWLSLAELWTEK